METFEFQTLKTGTNYFFQSDQYTSHFFLSPASAAAIAGIPTEPPSQKTKE